MTAIADPTDPRSAIANALAAYLTEDQTKKLVDEVLATTKRIPVKLHCENCGHMSRGVMDVPDARAVVSALTDLLAQGFGRPGEAKVEDAAIVFKRLTKLDEEVSNGSTGATRRPGRARKAVAGGDRKPGRGERGQGQPPEWTRPARLPEEPSV